MSEKLNVYDQYPFESQPGPERHIDRFEVIGRLFGVHSATDRVNRVLEIGCSTGKNLIPLAEQYPDTEFVGLDISSSSIEIANNIATEVALSNIKFLNSDIQSTEVDLQGKFDFVICHGVLSWVEASVRDQIFKVISETLSQNGIAYLSYNLMPGWATRGEVRTRVLENDDLSLDVGERIKNARRLMQSWEHDLQGDLTLEVIRMKDELQKCLTQSDAFLLHEMLAKHSRPFFLREVVEKAEEVKLQYLGEAFPPRMYNPSLDECDELSEDFSRFEKEQDIDHHSTRAFRGTLLCRGDQQLSRFARAEEIETLLISTPLVPRADKPDIHSEKYVEFVSANGRAVKENRPIVKAAFVYLRGFWPEAVVFQELFESASALISDEEGSDEDRRLLQGVLCQYFFEGDVDLHARALPCSRRVAEKPVTLRSIRSEARRDWEVTSMRHEYVQLDQFQRQTIQFCDGNHTTIEIAALLFECVEQGVLNPHEEGASVRDPERIREIIREGLEFTLDFFAEHALLLK